MSAVVAERLLGRSLVSDELFERLTARVERDEGHEPELAARIVDQALAFLGTCAVHRVEPLSPSRMVDAGWHAFVLHTREYHTFCRRIAGRFIDHVPTDNLPAGAGETASPLRRTVAAMQSLGYAVDDELWFSSDNADCTGCHNGCHDDPPPVEEGY
jgi:hypothetical protein